jgi:hypothetical protein
VQLWRLEPLKRDLAAGHLPDRQMVQYIAVQAAVVAALVVPTPGQDLPPWWHFVVSAAVAVAGVYFCYKMNGGAGGERFAERYFSIGWVVAVRVGVTSLVIGAITAMILFAILTPEASAEQGALLIDLVGYGLMVLSFWRTGVHIGDVVHRPRSATKESADA